MRYFYFGLGVLNCFYEWKALSDILDMLHQKKNTGKIKLKNLIYLLLLLQFLLFTSYS